MRAHLITLIGSLCLLFGTVLAWAAPYYVQPGESVYEKLVINRPKDGPIDFSVYLISNIPQDEVMQTVCGEALSRPKHCTYLSLASLGTYGRKKKDLLPYNTDTDTETVVVVDRATLTDAERANLHLLMTGVFPAVRFEEGQSTIQLRVQNIGKKGSEYQVLVNIPTVKKLDKAMQELRDIPTSACPPKEHRSKDIVHEIDGTAILCNDEQAEKMLRAVMPYSEVEVFPLERYQAFRDMETINGEQVTRRIIAVNWNGDQPFTPEMGRQLFPAPLQDRCSQTTPDRTGVSGWQRFCREAFAQLYLDDTVPTWVICGPTATFLRMVTAEVTKAKLTGGPYRVQIADMTGINNLAVGAYIHSDEPDRRRLILQQQMEERAGETLRSRVRAMVSTEDWGSVLQEVLNPDPNANDPFKDPSSLRRINQAKHADAVLLLWVQEIKPQVRYDSTSARKTERLGPFTRSAPSEPNKPDPDDKKLFGGYRYPGGNRAEREKSDEYQRDQARYEESYEQYRRDSRKWQQDKEEWEDRRRSMRVNYDFQITTNPQVEMRGYLKVIDLVATQKVLWTSDVARLRRGDTRILKTIPVQVIGDDTAPREPDELAGYPTATTWDACVRAIGSDGIYPVGQNLLVDVLGESVERLAISALWANDLKPWNKPGVAPATPKCPICGKEFTSQPLLEQHIKDVHTFRCPFCQQVCSTQDELDEHVEVKHTFPCPACTKVFRSRAELDDHLKALPLFTCTTCKAGFHQQAALEAHVREAHWLICDACEQQFPDQAALDAHRKTHVKATFTCEQCQERFDSKEALEQHRAETHATAGWAPLAVCNGKQVLVSLNDMVAWLPAKKNYNAKTGYITVIRDAVALSVKIKSTRAVVNGEEHQMETPLQEVKVNGKPTGYISLTFIASVLEIKMLVDPKMKTYTLYHPETNQPLVLSLKNSITVPN